MGLNKQTKTPFCTVEYLTREAVEIAIETLDNAMLMESKLKWIGMLDLKKENSMLGVLRGQRRDKMRRKKEPERPSENSLLGKIKVKEYLRSIYM